MVAPARSERNGNGVSSFPEEWIGAHYGVIPRVVRLDQKLTDGDKLTLVDIVTYIVTCREAFPSIEVLALTAGVTAKAVRGRITNLVARGLLMVEYRNGETSRYTLAKLTSVYTPAQIKTANKVPSILSERLRTGRDDPERTGRGKPWSKERRAEDKARRNPEHTGDPSPIGYPQPEGSETPNPGVRNPQPEGSPTPNLQVREPLTSRLPEGDVLERCLKGDDERDVLDGRTTSSPASQDPSGTILMPSRGALGNEGSGDMAEAEDLMTENEVPAPARLRRKSKKRAASSALVSGDESPRTPFPEALRSSQSNADVVFDTPPPPPPVETPEDLVLLLRGEMESRWGKKAPIGFAEVLTGELRGKLTNCVLRQYQPGVILSMVRLLVWDWEVARGVCFPFKTDLAYPTVESLAQYAKELAARIETGFDYMEKRRGALNTYHDLFIRRLAFIPDDDPF